MLKALAVTIVTLNTAYAQECCPTTCPATVGTITTSCCKTCPSHCDQAPYRIKPILMQTSTCAATDMSWEALSSCAPITGTEIKCADKNGRIWPLRFNNGPALTYKVDNRQFMGPPFNLQVGDPLWCKIRGYNKHGSGPWSFPNNAHYLSPCDEAVWEEQAVVAAPEFMVAQAPAPVVGMVVEGPGPISGMVVERPGPISGMVVERPRPIAGMVVEGPAPVAGMVVQLPAPIAGMVVERPAPIAGMVIEAPAPMYQCPCLRSCRMTGCAGCCGPPGVNERPFWNKVQEKTAEVIMRPALSAPRPVAGQEVTDLNEKEHKHEYCHIHPEERNRVIKKTVWREEAYTAKNTIFRPFTRTIKKTILEQQKRMVPVTKFETKIVKGRKMVNKSVTRQVKKIVMVKKTIQTPETQMKKEMRMEKRTDWKDEKRTRQKVRMVERIVNRDEVVMEDHDVTKKAIRMIKQSHLVKKRVPQEFVPVNDCNCHIVDCGCLGSTDCSCAYPMCQCAPEVRHRNVEVLEEYDVPEEYSVTTIEQRPKVIHVPTKIFEPVEYYEDYSERVPVVVEFERQVEVPIVVQVDTVIEVPTEVSEEVTEMVPTEVEFDKEIQVPVTQDVEVEVAVPVEIDHEITEQKGVEELVKGVRKVPYTVEEKIPDPPCHWHEESHSHPVEVGKMHSHNMNKP